MIVGRKFRVDYALIDDVYGAISSSDIVVANSKYDAKRTIKRKRPDVVIKRIIPFASKEEEQ